MTFVRSSVSQNTWFGCCFGKCVCVCVLSSPSVCGPFFGSLRIFSQAQGNRSTTVLCHASRKRALRQSRTFSGSNRTGEQFNDCPFVFLWISSECACFLFRGQFVLLRVALTTWRGGWFVSLLLLCRLTSLELRVVCLFFRGSNDKNRRVSLPILQTVLTRVYRRTWTGSCWMVEKMCNVWVRRLKACVAAKGGLI